jgi:hypothetical protein
MRTRLAVAGAATVGDRVLVQYPSGEVRPLSPGPSSEITKAVVEVFATKFLARPAVLWLSESATKVITRDERLASEVGLSIAAAELLPDVILVDLGPDDPLIVFVEVVHSDGAITDRRQEALWKLSDEGGFDRKQIAFVTAYRDRDRPGFKRTIAGLAWRSFAWFVSEPDHVLIMRDGSTRPSLLSTLLGD